MEIRRRHRIKRQVIGGLVLLAGLLLAGFILYQKKVNPMLEGMARAMVDNVASNTINEAIDAQIADGNIDYNRLVLFEKDLNGKITAMK